MALFITTYIPNRHVINMWESDQAFPKTVLELSLRKYNELPKKGKPKKNEEWTPLATILCRDESGGQKTQKISLWGCDAACPYNLY